MTPPGGTRAERMARALTRTVEPVQARAGLVVTPGHPQGYERPAVMPPRSEDLAAERYERRFVREKRRQGVGWQNIANMLSTERTRLQALYGEGA